MNELITIEQLPVIRQRLETMSAEIKQKTAEAQALVCTEENLTVVRGVRSDLTKRFTALDTQRIEIKNKILAPYDALNDIFKKLITDPYTESDKKLKEKINTVENDLKLEKEKAAMRYFAELKAAEKIDFVAFDQIGLNVTLNATVPALKKQVKAFMDRVASDLALIDVQEHKAEILVEYKKTLNASKAITDVVSRYQAIEEEKKRIAEREASRIAQNERIAQVDTFLPPPVAEPVSAPQRVVAASAPAPSASAKIFNVTFKVYGTVDQLKAMKAYLVANNLRYENVPAPAAVSPAAPQPQANPVVPDPAIVEERKALEEEATRFNATKKPGDPVAFVQFRNKEGSFSGREYSYVIPGNLISEVTANCLVDVATRNGIASAIVTRLGTTADIPADIIPKLMMLEGISKEEEGDK